MKRGGKPPFQTYENVEVRGNSARPLFLTTLSSLGFTFRLARITSNSENLTGQEGWLAPAHRQRGQYRER
jgi:hypothetical protein